jgi:putative transposase
VPHIYSVFQCAELNSAFNWGKVKKELGLDERTYHCGCGNCMDRDVNAAVNIREEGRRILKTA